MGDKHLTTWRKEITKYLKLNGETWNDVVSHTFKDCELECEFDSVYGGSTGMAFTLWTKERVYFPVIYDGSEWIESVSRNPDGIPTSHVMVG